MGEPGRMVAASGRTIKRPFQSVFNAVTGLTRDAPATRTPEVQ